MEIIRERMEVQLNRSASETIWETLSKTFRPLIYGVKTDLKSLVEVEPFDSSIFYGAEIFCAESGQIMFYRIDREKSEIETGAVFSEHEGRQAYQGFKQMIRDTLIGEKHSRAEWVPVAVENSRFELVKQVTGIIDSEPKEIDAALLLRDDGLRQILRRINEKGECYQEEIMQGPEDYKTTEYVSQLENLGLIKKEFYVFCKDNGQQISKVNSLQALEEARDHGFKCFSCGRLISEERIAPRLKCFPGGEKLARPNYWLALQLVDALKKARQNVKDTYCVIEKDGRIFDLFTGFYDKFLMFEVKDEPVRLEDVFMFLSRVNYYRPFRAILVSSYLVPLEVRMYLKNYSKHPLILVEGIDELPKTIDDCFQLIKEVYIENVFTVFSKETDIKIADIFVDKFYPQADGIMQPQRGAISQFTSSGISHPDSVSNSDKMVDFTEVIPSEEMHIIEFRPGDEDEYISPEMLSTAEIPSAVTVEMEISPVTDDRETSTLTDEASKAEELLEYAEVDYHQDNQTLSAGEVNGAFDKTSFDEEEKDGVSSDHANDFDFKMDFDEAMPYDMDPAEETMIVTEASEEDLEKAAAFILDFVAEKGLTGNITRIERELTMGFYGPALVDSNGLVISHNMGIHVDSEAISAYSTTVAESIRRAMRDSDIDEAKSIQVEGRHGRVRIFCGDDLYLITHEEKKASDTEDEAGSLPGETILREAILKKVLDDLSRTEGVHGSIVAGYDGLVIESSLPDDIEPDSMGYLTGQVMSENEKCFKNLGIGEIRQILIKAKDNFYNIMPIDAENALMTRLDPQVPREIWQSGIPQAAQMIKSALM